MSTAEKIKNSFSSILIGNISMKFISPKYCFFLFAIIIIYMTNHNYVERDLRRISELKNEIKELRNEAISTSSELMNMSKQSEVLKRINKENLQLKELTEPPRIVNR